MTPEEFEEQSQVLLDRFAAAVDDADEAEDARFALDYKFVKGDYDLTHWVGDDVDELLFGYLPNNAFLDEVEAEEALESIARFIEFLGAEGALARGSDRAVHLAAHLRSHRAEFKVAMADPESGGPSKRILAALLADGIDIEDSDAVNEWLDDFNAGPIERRDAVLGLLPDLDDFDDEPAIELPPRPPVDPTEARQSAAAAPLLKKVMALAEFLGDGRPVTQKGNLKLADARRLVDLLETGDRTDYDVGGKEQSFRSAVELIWLDMIVWLATEVEAVRVHRGKMSGDEVWLRSAEEEPLSAAEELVTTLIDVGPLTALMGERDRLDSRTVIDSMPVSLLAGLYEEDRPFDGLVASLVQVVPNLVDVPDWYLTDRGNGNYLYEAVHWDTERLVRILEWVGVLIWRDSHSLPDRRDLGRLRSGGTLSITPFGESLVQGRLASEGVLSAPVVEPLAVTLDDPPEAIIGALAGYIAAGPATLAQAWSELGGYDGLPDQLWRVDHPSTFDVLEALGEALPDKPTAKAARKALLKHRSWRASRN